MRYAVLVLLNLPILISVVITALTQYKLHRITIRTFGHRLLFWGVLFTIILGSFPVYNAIIGLAPFESDLLSYLDIIQTTAIVYLFFIINNLRQRIELNEQFIRELHEELSINRSN
jgi:ABC-type glycerol-3-phosphate transport system permease component